MSKIGRRFSLAGLALALAAAMGLPPSTAQAALNNCSQPISTGAAPTAVDYLAILNVAVGSRSTNFPCIHAPKGSLPVVATDALYCLQRSVLLIGDEDLNCPCGGFVDLQDDDYAFGPADVDDPDIQGCFTDVDYIGAFEQSADPAAGDWTLGWTIGLHQNNTVWEPATGGTLGGGVPSATGSCPAGTTPEGNPGGLPGGFAGNMDYCRLAGRYDTDGTTITLTNDNIYLLGLPAGQGTFIGDGDAAGATQATAADVTIAIEPGTLILGEDEAALAITRGAKIEANGTAVDPIVMSSQAWFDAWLAGGDGRSGRAEWGGLVVTGFSQTNDCNNAATCDALVEGFTSPFAYGGGTSNLDLADDSGNIDYLIVRQGGFDLDGNGSEINGLTMYTLGTGTSVSHVQIHQNVDDGIEFFGGKFCVDHLVVTGAGDDSIDHDLGWSGGVQFALVKQFDDLADRGFESDGDGDGGFPACTGPQSLPVYANVTVLGSQGASDQTPDGIHMFDGTGGHWWNGIIVDSERTCIDEEAGRVFECTDPDLSNTPGVDDLTIQNYVVDCANSTLGNFGTANVSTWYNNGPTNRTVDPRVSETGYPSTPTVYFGDQYAFGPGNVADADLKDCVESVRYIGAFDQSVAPSSGNWTDGWTIYTNGNNTVWEPATGGTLGGGVPSATGTCPAGTTPEGNPGGLPGGFAGNMDYCRLAGRYDTPGMITLTNDNIYLLGLPAGQGTFVGNGDAAGSTQATVADVELTIEPGTLILGEDEAALAITRGAKIHANGTAVDPIVMSSQAWFDAWLAGGDGRSGRAEWGGLVVTGFSQTNECNNAATCDALVEGFTSPFAYGGGTANLDVDDDSGNIDYVIVRQGGFDLDGNGSEINGLTMYTLGLGTTISHAQVHQNVDDGIEFFGGKACVDHLVITGAGDDSIDHDLGWSGAIQYALVQQFDDLADRGFESDGDGDGGFPACTDPKSLPIYANVTVMGNQGADDQTPDGIHMFDGTGGHWWNGIVQNSERTCIDEEAGRVFECTDPDLSNTPGVDDLTIQNFVVSCENATLGNFGTANVSTWYNNGPTNRATSNPQLSRAGYPVPVQ